MSAYKIRPSYIYLIAIDYETGNWLASKPRHKIQFDLKYKPFQDLALALDTEYRSEQYTRSDNKESVPGYFLADIRADYYLKKIRLFLKIENLFDKDYDIGEGYPGSPLTWTTGLNYEV